jgi:hypothetical protein
LDHLNLASLIRSTQNQRVETPPKFGAGIAVAGVSKVDGSFENRLKEQTHYRRSIGMTGSVRKTGNHY